jgi:hypothetical protein
MYKQVSLCENIHLCGKLGIGHPLPNQEHILISRDLAFPQKCNIVHHLPMHHKNQDYALPFNQ